MLIELPNLRQGREMVLSLLDSHAMRRIFSASGIFFFVVALWGCASWKAQYIPIAGSVDFKEDPELQNQIVELLGLLRENDIEVVVHGSLYLIYEVSNDQHQKAITLIIWTVILVTIG